ncbi:hypothetical protein [Kitasatospora sp. NPDC005751]|uniref:hypothetical protein n=1 Tax=unclassified Kitasatospora TaxID=2633591 RepID=UPI0034074341
MAQHDGVGGVQGVVGGVQGVVGGLARKGGVVVAGRAGQLEQQQSVVPDQLLAEGEELGRQRGVGQSFGEPGFTPG